MDTYSMISKRKSFHLFRGLGDARIEPEELQEIEAAWAGFEALCPEIRTALRIVPARQVRFKGDAEYCLLLYSEQKPHWLTNIGYLGEQLDLWLVSRDVGTLWFGIGKPDQPAWEGLDFVIMLAVHKVDDPSRFRRDVYKCRRKPLEEGWRGETLGVAELARFAPSACNSQPWYVENDGETLSVYRLRKHGRRGIMPLGMVGWYNRIDVGIYLLILEVCLRHGGWAWRRELAEEADDGKAGPALTAVYRELRRGPDAAQVERVSGQEARLNAARRLLALPSRSPAQEAALEEAVAALEAYYGSPVWKEDFAADEAGLLPAGLRRGVLSEDGIYNLLEQYRER